MKTALLLILFSSLLPMVAMAKGIEGLSGGGDETGLEFEQHYHNALAILKEHYPDFYEEMLNAGLDPNMHALVILAESPLKVVRDGVEQISVAKNFPESNLILVNRERWNAI